jgi:hypothetical protein
VILLAWLRERGKPWLFLPLSLALAWVAGAPLVLGTVQAALLVYAFRLRDDLADADSDPPERVLPSARSRAPFWSAYAVLLLGGSLVSPWVLLLAAVFELLYRTEVGGRHRWVLLKYPLFAAFLGSADLALLTILYLLISVYERLSDPVLRQRKGNQVRVGLLLVAAMGVALVW